MTFDNKPINWESEGVEPSSSLKESGYVPGQKLPAGHMNFFVSFLMKAISELQNLLNTVFATKTDLSSGLAGKADSSHTHSAYAPKASPTFTGTPKAPTAATGTNTTQIATTAFVQKEMTEAGAHTHSNKSVLDSITSSDVSDWDSAYNDSHTHSNKSVLDDITATKISDWNTAFASRHSHSNMAALDNFSVDADGNMTIRCYSAAGAIRDCTFAGAEFCADDMRAQCYVVEQSGSITFTSNSSRPDDIELDYSTVKALLELLDR